MTAVTVRRVSGAELLARQDAKRHVYAEAFAEPRWNEDGRATGRS
ncbi:hypothetical protein [Streptomyces sp. NPDC088762]